MNLTRTVNLPRRSAVALATVTVFAAFLPAIANAKYGPITGKGDINIVAAAMPAMQSYAKVLETCNRGAVKVDRKSVV